MLYSPHDYSVDALATCNGTIGRNVNRGCTLTSCVSSVKLNNGIMYNAVEGSNAAVVVAFVTASIAVMSFLVEPGICNNVPVVGVSTSIDSMSNEWIVPSVIWPWSSFWKIWRVTFGSKRNLLCGDSESLVRSILCSWRWRIPSNNENRDRLTSGT